MCYVEDLFVSPEARGKSLGELLIKSVVKQAEEHDWRDVYWQTQHDNNVARGLYNKLTGGTDWYVTYQNK